MQSVIDELIDYLKESYLKNLEIIEKLKKLRKSGFKEK
jgi:hypothetical protein